MAVTGRTVLIIDDSDEDRVALRRYLEHDSAFSYSCSTAKTVAEGLAQCRVLRPDAILLDYGLPDKDGLAVLSALVAEHSLYAFAIVILSGVGNESTAVEAMKAGAQDYLVKGHHLKDSLGARLAAAIDKVGLLRQVEQQSYELEQSHCRLEQALAAQRESETRLQMALQAARMTTWDLDLSSKQIQSSAISDAAAPMLANSVGSSRDAFWSLVHPEDRVRMHDQLSQAMRKGDDYEIEFRERRPDGHMRWIARRGRVIRDTDGQPLRILGIDMDITERKQAETALVEERALLAQRVEERTAELSTANRELERAARLKDEFLASMSHELRTPLNTVLGFSEALRERVYGPLSDRQDQALGMIEESGRHLLDLIGDILDLARIGAGKLDLDLEMTDVAEICHSSLRMLRQAAQTRQLTVELTLDPAATYVRADGRRLRQILINLLANAIKFTPPGGAVGLDVTAIPERQLIAFTIRDTGIGIAEDDLGRLFQPFVQLDGRLSRQYEGTGLGLALVHRMTELHGGYVGVSSQVGVGSRFTVSLPWR